LSNTKNVSISGEVPFNWLDSATTEEYACLANWLLSPGMGIHMEYQASRTLPSSTFDPKNLTGRTSMYWVYIDGVEAVKIGALEVFVNLINRTGFLLEAGYEDLDNPGDRYNLMRGLAVREPVA
jgi:hypothetical protein